MEAEVLFDYEKQEEDELDLAVGDTITNVTQVDDGWCQGTYKGKTGMFPDNFVRLKPASAATVTTTTSKPQKPPPPNPTPPVVTRATGTLSDPPVVTRATDQTAKSRRAMVTFSYTAENTDELTLQPGQSVEVLGEEEDGWWRGQLGGKEGLFPSNFVEISTKETTPPGGPPESAPAPQITTDGPPQIPPDRPRPPVGVGTAMGLPRFNPAEVKLKSTAAHPPPPAREKEAPKIPELKRAAPLPPKTQPASKPPPIPLQEPASDKAEVIMAEVMFAYTAEQEDELTIKVKDIVEVVDRTEQDGWWKVKLGGKVGLVPDNFVELLSTQPESSEPPPVKKEHRRPPPAPVETADKSSDFGVPVTEPLDSSAVKERPHRPGGVRPPSRANLHQEEIEVSRGEEEGQAPWQKELKLRKKKDPVKPPPAKPHPPPPAEVDKKPLPRATTKPSLGDKPKLKPPPAKPAADTVKAPPPLSVRAAPPPSPPSTTAHLKTPPPKPSDTGSTPSATPTQSSDKWGKEAIEKLREELAEFKVQIRKEIKTLSADLDVERKTNAGLRIDIDRLQKSVAQLESI